MPGVLQRGHHLAPHLGLVAEIEAVSWLQSVPLEDLHDRRGRRRIAGQIPPNARPVSGTVTVSSVSNGVTPGASIRSRIFTQGWLLM